MAELVFRKLTKQYRPNLRPALDRLDLSIRDGECVALVGPPGSGKSTALRMTAGLETVSAGQILIGGKVVNDSHPKDRRVGLAFDDYALYAPLSVRDNLAFTLRARKIKQTEIDKRIAEISRQLQVEELLDLAPSALINAQKQRVNIARAVIRRPAVLLLDEPLSSLDAASRVRMRTEIKRLHAEHRFTTVVATRNQSDAMALADRIAVLNEGKLQQYDTPLQVFNHPANEFVAGVLGQPPMTIFPVSADSRRRLVVPGTELAFPLNSYLARLLGNRTSARLGIRPWGVRVSQTSSELSVPGTVSTVENLGDETWISVRYGDVLVMASTARTRIYKPGSKVYLTFEDEDINLFDQATGKRLTT